MDNKKDRIIGIYKIENKYNHKVYIGQSQNIKSRCKTHMKDLKSNTHCNKGLQDDFLKYGFGGFTFDILESCKRSELFDDLGKQEYHWDIILLCREYYYMNYYSKTHQLYNIDETLKKELLTEKYIKKRFNDIRRNQHEQSQNFVDFIKQYPMLVQDNKLTLSEMFIKVFGDNQQKYIDYGKTCNFSAFYKQLINKKIIPSTLTKSDILNVLIKLNILYYGQHNRIQPYNKYIDEGYFVLNKPHYIDGKLLYYRLSITQKGIKFLIKLLQDSYNI